MRFQVANLQSPKIDINGVQKIRVQKIKFGNHWQPLPLHQKLCAYQKTGACALIRLAADRMFAFDSKYGKKTLVKNNKRLA
jgi:hypothetical protein